MPTRMRGKLQFGGKRTAQLHLAECDRNNLVPKQLASVSVQFFLASSLQFFIRLFFLSVVCMCSLHVRVASWLLILIKRTQPDQTQTWPKSESKSKSHLEPQPAATRPAMCPPSSTAEMLKRVPREPGTSLKKMERNELKAGPTGVAA